MRGIRFWNNSTGLLLALTLALLAPANALPARSVAAQGDELPEPIELPEVDPLSITGDIAIAGSSTVEPVTVAMAARFSDDGYTGNIAVAETGTSAGFERFCKEGSTDISNASRAIKDSERADCAAIGRDVLEFLIGIDALTVAVSRDSFVDALTRSQLIAIFTGAVTQWNEVNPAWPAATIQLFTPGTDSGTFDFFGEAVLGTQGVYKGREARFGALLAPNPTISENDYTLVEGIRGSENAIGYFGFAYFAGNEDTLKAVIIADDMTYDADDNLIIIPAEQWEAEGIAYVAPSRATAASGEYLLSRPLFIYSAASILRDKPQVAAFVNYYLTNAEEVVAEEGYFPAGTEALNAARQTWLGAMGLAE
ncbi:MAG: phosphate ABC transporter substrate-binding protein PstS family protein [Anaerolineae bacterium]|nr:phosphate ABC transporter substrate-binding protein PstS family protein [Anaerolineae bacterium]